MQMQPDPFEPEVSERGLHEPAPPGFNPPGRLQSQLERFSLSKSEAKALVAVMRLGSCTVHELVPLTGIGGSNLYRVLEPLNHQRLIRKIPKSPAVWVALSHEALLARLLEREQEHLREAEAALDDVRLALASVPEATAAAAAVFKVTDGPGVALAYGEALGSVARELLVFNRGPYLGEIVVSQGVVAAVARGVSARALWQSSELSGPGSEVVRRAATDYAHVGVATRVVEEVPMPMAVFDRSLTLVSVPSGVPDDLAFVASVMVENGPYSTLMASVFELWWDRASPLDSSLL